MAADKNTNDTTNNIYEEFNLKGGRPVPEQPFCNRQGRMYATKYSEKPGGLRVEDMIWGVKMAQLSCTDDSDTRLAKAAPNTIACLGLIVGQGNERKPLSILLKEHFDLKLDCWIDESGIKHGRAVDTQGFIASNDDTIVLSYRYTTTIMDWVTNVSMTSSEWEPDRDELIGHAGFCSCMDGLFTKYFTSRGKPRVHTGFYNNFIYTIPHIRKHILEPLLKKDATPKKVYIVGASLGAAISTMAFCFVLQEMLPSLENPDFVHHKLINVTAGSPRVCDRKMQQYVMGMINKLKPLDRAVVCRMVYNKDLVPHIPFQIMRFVHLEKLVYITPNGDVLINPKLTKTTEGFAEAREVFHNFTSSKKKKDTDTTDNNNQQRQAEETAKGDNKTPFELECEKTPEPIKDHMAFWYLTMLNQLKVKVDAGEV